MGHKIAVLIPDRNDRPRFLENCLRMLKRQTLQPDHIELVNYPATITRRDITQRYRHGYNKLCGAGYSCIFFIENDDWYAADYLEVMFNEWVKRGMPDMLGTCYTIYYHIGINWYFTMHHMERASAMNTLIKPNLNLHWPVDEEPFTDTYLWAQTTARNGNGDFTGVIFDPGKIIAMGIKHEVGMCGGSHDRHQRYHQFGTNDESKAFLRATLDKESFNFYANYFNQ